MTRDEWLDWVKTRQDAGFSAVLITLDVTSDPLESRNWRAGNERELRLFVCWRTC